jgi:protein-S-isoprenylcysteine O-methyltransferase Ste14
VRIQEDRGQTVVSDGPYRAIRHPGYVGGFLFYSGLAGALGSAWCFLTLGVSLALLVLRTALEDATLRRELPGYEDYCRRTRFRLFPGLW